MTKRKHKRRFHAFELVPGSVTEQNLNVIRQSVPYIIGEAQAVRYALVEAANSLKPWHVQFLHAESYTPDQQELRRLVQIPRLQDDNGLSHMQCLHAVRDVIAEAKRTPADLVTYREVYEIAISWAVKQLQENTHA